ncbi:MAG TPA: hypothetical protein VG826_04070 [Pirellulales bacterium]|nr:hypothetical protein [Pirellulales bacterium]
MVVSRKIAEGIYGGHEPRDVAAAVALGILAGALAGGNLSWAAVFLAAILFNVHTRIFLATWLASVLLAWLSRGVAEDLGRSVLDRTPLGRAIGQLGENTLVALLGWDEYALVGGAMAGAIAAIAGATIAYWATCQLRRRWVPTGTGLPTDKADWDDGPAGRGRPLLQVWYGPSSHEQRARRGMAPRRLRPWGVPATLAAAVTVAIASWSLARLSAERELWRELSVYNGAQVSCGRTQLSLWSGDFVLHDLVIADAARPDRDRFRIGVAKGRLSPGLLLRGRLKVERVVLRQVRADVARRQPAQVYDSCDAGPVAVDRNLRVYSPSAGDVDITSYLRPWRTICRRLGDLQHLVAAIDRLTLAEHTGEFSRERRRSDLGRPQPRVAIEELRVDGLPSAWSLGGKALVEIAHLSSNASLASKPARARILLPKFGAEVQLDFSSQKSLPHTIRCVACDVDFGPWSDARLAVSGRARLAGQGSFDREGFELRALVEVESLMAEVKCAEPLIGVEAELWNRSLRQVPTCDAQIVCFGPWSSPGVVTDGGQLVERVRRQLRAAGQEDLVATIEQRMVQHLERQAALQEEPLSTPTVMQATAIEVQTGREEPQTPPSQPGLREFATEDAAYQAACEGQIPAPSDDADSSSRFTYPTTSAPYEDGEYSSRPASVTYDDEEHPSPPRAAIPATPFTPSAGTSVVMERPLPGPVQMAVGRDRYTGQRTPLAAFGVEPETAPRDSLWSRWTHGFRQKFSQAFGGQKGTIADPPEPAEAESPPSFDDRAIPTAGSDAWYKRRWR